MLSKHLQPFYSGQLQLFSMAEKAFLRCTWSCVSQSTQAAILDAVRLFGFSIVEDGSDSGFREHFKHPEYVHELFGKTWENFVCVIGDHCNANKRIASFRGVSFVDCASHRFPLAVCNDLEVYATTLFHINALK